MRKEQEDQLNKMAKEAAWAHQNQTAQAGSIGGGNASIGSGNASGNIHGLTADCATARPGLRDRIQGQAQSAEYQAHKAGRLRELTELLDRNPEVARILDLLDEVR